VAPRCVEIRRSSLPAVPIFRLHDATGGDLGLVEHPTPNLEPGDVVELRDGREAIVTSQKQRKV
jgi:hypothetical protein